MVIAVEPQRASAKLKINLPEIKKTNGFTPRVQRIKQTWMDFQSKVSSDRGYYYMESWKQTEGEHESIRIAKMFRNYCENCRIDVRDDELLVGGQTHWPRGSQPRPETEPVPLLARLKQQYETLTTVSTAVACAIDQYDLERLIEACAYFKDYFEAKAGPNPTVRKYGVYMGGDITHTHTPWERARQVAFMGMPPQPDSEGQVVGLPMPSLVIGCDYKKVLGIGFNGIITEIRDRIAHIEAKPRRDITTEDLEAIELLNSWIITLEGVIIYSRRHAALAREKAAAEADPQRKKELLKIADVCENVPANPARDFHEALQSSWYIQAFQEIEKNSSNALIGRFDQYCYPYYARDLEEGRITRQDAAELMGCMFMKWQSLESFTPWGFQRLVPGSYLANVNVGGVDKFGKDASNELSCMLLHVVSQVKVNQPHVSLQYHRAMAPELLQASLECTRDHGAGIPAWFSTPVILQYLCDRGIPLEEAREDGTVLGCVNIGVAKGYIWDRIGGTSFINHAKLIELALHNGVDPLSGMQLGPETGDPRNFKTFDEMEEAYRRQYEYFVEYELAKYKGWTKEWYFEQRAYSPFSSPLNEDCIPRAKDLHKGGMRYFDELCGGNIIDRAQSDATDSLLAIKYVVFDNKYATMDELLAALKADWVGYDELKAKCLEAPRYGNDDDEADLFHVKWWNYTKDMTMYLRDFKGLRMAPHRQGAGWAQLAGRVTGPLPNGRKGYTALSDAAVSPCQGADRKGPTALLNSAAKLDPNNCEAPLLNMRFTPGPLKTRDGLQKFGNLVATFFDQGAAHAQFTILDRETLLDAKAHPENYQSLVVRVAGYSAFWVELTPEVQDEIITRTQHDL